MKRTMEFTKRNLLELSRDMLGYIFCIAFPIVMLIVMSVVNESIPKEAGMSIFRIDNLAGGIMIFGQTFVMLFTAILVSTDRDSSFLVRLYTTPMQGRDFVFGYILPMLAIAVLQSLVIAAASLVIAGITGFSISVPGLLLSVITIIPSALFFIALGLIFGSLFNEKAAPGICSVIVSGGSFLGAVFFDAEQTGGPIYSVCRCLPFIYCTKAARSTIRLDFAWKTFGISMLVTVAAAVVCMTAAIFCFQSIMRAER